ncbi:hypothetical protein V3C99_005477 [Haemonchus contortus]
MPTDTSPKKSDGNDQAGLKASIVKAIFKDLSPPRTRVVGNAIDLLTATARISSPSKKLGDLSLSEGDLTLTEDFKTPVSLSVSQSQSHFFANDDFEGNPVIESTAKDKPAAKCTRKPKDVREVSDSGVSSRGPNSKQLAWLRACRKGDLVECKKLLEENPDLLHYVPPHHLNYSAVHIATLGRHYELLRFLKSKKANFNATTRIGYTPLHLAAQNQDQETARLLIREFGVDSRIHDLLGYTYEHYADWLDYPEYDETTSRFSYRGASSRSSSRQPSLGSQESLASSKTSFSRHGSLRDTIRGILHVPIAIGLKSRSPSLNQLAV